MGRCGDRENKLGTEIGGFMLLQLKIYLNYYDACHRIICDKWRDIEDLSINHKYFCS